ncbi:unnamed protein product, partial [Mesorhabditis spiculigera]
MEITRQGSEGIGFERVVWVPDPANGYVLGDITDIRANALSVKRRVDGKEVDVKADDVFPAEETTDGTTYDDNCALMYLNEGSLLENCRRRFAKDNQIYTYVANMLISINPYAEVPGLYSTETMASYSGKSIGQQPPHVYAIADKAFRDMRRQGRSQSILVSGESGAGKTESQKAVLKYLCENWGQTAGPIQQRLLETNPILEAFGNAKTSRNNNSSRFGKFVEIHFDNKNAVTGGHVSHYLLEKSRIVGQSDGERNYHIFYQLIAGADADMYKLYSLAPPDRFHYLRRGSVDFFARADSENAISQDRLAAGKTCIDPVVDDVGDFKRLLACLEQCGLDETTRKQLLSTVAGVLHLGNVEVPLKPAEAAAARDALAKAIYSRLFDWIVATINKSIPFTNSHNYIGVLDIAGFEYFTVNSFEQFCINYCNEKLQHFFNERILKQEQELYEAEGLGVAKIEYADNQDCIELFEKKGTGMLDLLDEEMRLPKPSAANFTQGVHRANQKHFRLDAPRKSMLKEHRGMRDEDGLLVRHFAGTVCYQTAGFLEKNNDALHASLEAIMETSTMPLMKLLFETSEAAAAAPSTPGRSRLVVPSGTHFVRCVKPNSSMSPWKFEGAAVLGQLRCAGMGSVLRLMHAGYPSRTGFKELYDMYASVLPPELARLDPRLFCKCLFRVLGLDTTDFKFGLTKVFFRPAKFAEFDQLLRQDPSAMALLVAKVKQWLLNVRWRKAQYGVWSVIKLKNKIEYRAERLRTIQRLVRGFLARRRTLPRLALFKKVEALTRRGTEMQGIVEQLAPASKDEWGPEVDGTQKALVALLGECKDQESDLAANTDAYEECVRRVDKIISALKGQMATDEAERLAAIERQMQLEREREEAAHAEQLAAAQLREENERKRRELEEQRERAERVHLARLEQQREELLARAEQVRQDAMLATRIAQQEQLDAQLAARLAAEERGQATLVEPPPTAVAPPPTASSSPVASDGPSAAKRAKYDLATWKYAALREQINTSDDAELVMACKEEFHRRLRTFSEWKTKNQTDKEKKTEANRDVPLALQKTEQPKRTLVGAQPIANLVSTQQRYFKAPLEVPLAMMQSSNPTAVVRSFGPPKGMWYAHFNGQWVQRQIEVRNTGEAVLLIAGRDDLEMCPQRLDQTALPWMKGAEILEHDFEKVWATCGGQPLGKPAGGSDNDE